MLEIEQAYFEANVQKWRETHMGKYVIVVGNELIGVFDTDEAAYEAGVNAKGNVPMLIKQVRPKGEDDDATFSAPALFLGLAYAAE